MVSRLVTGVADPPADETRKMELFPFAKRIVSSGPHAAPRGFAIPSATTCTAPPEEEIFLSFPPEKNPIQRASVDQNGFSPFSVPDKAWADVSAIGLSQRMGFAPTADAENTIARPSGESANCGTGTVAL